MKKKLYMHMGWSKTGTTTIQHFLYINRNILLEKGYCYPTSHVIDESIFNYKYENQIFAAQSFHGNWNKYQNLKPWTYYRDHILNEMQYENCKNNIISGEVFNYDHSDNIEFWQKYFNVTGIYYFRNIFDWLTSQQKEFIKYSLTPAVFTFDRGRNFCILACLRHHIRVLGRDNCVFIDFEKTRAKGTLIDDFMHTVGIHSISDFSFVADENKTPLDASLIFCYQMTFAPFERKEFKTIMQEVSEMDLSKFKYFRSNTLPKSIYKLDEYAQSAIRYQGELLNDPNWYDKTIARGEELAKIPYRDLDPEIQYYILENLSDYSRDLISSWLPAAKHARPDEPFLPTMKNVYDYRDVIISMYTKYCNLMRQ